MSSNRSYPTIQSLCSAVERKQCINMEGHEGDHNWVVDTTVEVLTADVRWLMRELADQSEVVYRVPEHTCGFEVAPETGHCEFHERWFDAAAHVGLLDEWNAEDLASADKGKYE
jgi:hypothetical protein